MDRYAILAPLGRGGMGTVYAAYDPKLDRKVAIKYVIGSGELATHIHPMREARALARFKHPNVVHVYEVEESGEHPFIVMELVEGRRLQTWIAQERPRAKTIFAAFEGAGEGLIAAHRVGLVHRDLKPDNMMIRDDGRAVLVDFGLAVSEGGRTHTPARSSGHLVVLEDSGTVLGTPGYMAPEQAAGAPPSAKADQFSFCVMLWEALYGQRPFGIATNEDYMRTIQVGALRGSWRSGVPFTVRALLRRGLQLEPARRFASMEDLLLALRRRLLWRRRVLLMCGCLGAAAVLLWLKAPNAWRPVPVADECGAKCPQPTLAPRGGGKRLRRSTT